MLRFCNAPLKSFVCVCVCVPINTDDILQTDSRPQKMKAMWSQSIDLLQGDRSCKTAWPPDFFPPSCVLFFFFFFCTINCSWHLRLHRVSTCIQRPPPMIPWTPPRVCCVLLYCRLTPGWHLVFFQPTNKWKVWNPLNFFPQPKRIHCSIYTLIITRSKWHSADVMPCHLCPEPWIKNTQNNGLFWPSVSVTEYVYITVYSSYF